MGTKLLYNQVHNIHLFFYGFSFEIDTNIVMLEYKTFTCFQTICKCKIYIYLYGINAK